MKRTIYDPFTRKTIWSDERPKRADLVEVVRCKNCKWWGGYGCAIIIVDESDKPKENDFCSFGERKDDDCRKTND